MVMSMLLGIAGLADAQKRNDKDIRDALRSLNSKIDDFEQNLVIKCRAASSNNSQVSDISDDIRALRDSVQAVSGKF